MRDVWRIVLALLLLLASRSASREVRISLGFRDFLVALAICWRIWEHYQTKKSETLKCCILFNTYDFLRLKKDLPKMAITLLLKDQIHLVLTFIKIDSRRIWFSHIWSILNFWILNLNSYSLSRKTYTGTYFHKNIRSSNFSKFSSIYFIYFEFFYFWPKKIQRCKKPLSKGFHKNPFITFF